MSTLLDQVVDDLRALSREQQDRTADALLIGPQLGPPVAKSTLAFHLYEPAARANRELVRQVLVVRALGLIAATLWNSSECAMLLFLFVVAGCTGLGARRRANAN
jgi:hypothetical protein